MTKDVAVVVRRSAIAGAAVSAVGIAGAVAGLGLAAFWLAIAFGAPLSLLVEHIASRRSGVPSHWEKVTPTRPRRTEEHRSRVRPETEIAAEPEVRAQVAEGRTRVESESFAERVEADLTAWSDLNAELARVVTTLPDAQKLVVALQYFERLRTADVADVLQVPPATVRELLRRAESTLASAGYSLEDWGSGLWTSQRGDAGAHKFATSIVQRAMAEIAGPESGGEAAFFLACERFAEVDMLARVLDPTTMKSDPTESPDAYAELLENLWRATVGALSAAATTEIYLREGTEEESFADARARTTWEFHSAILDEASPDPRQYEEEELLHLAALNLVRTASAFRRQAPLDPGDSASLVDASFYMVWFISRLFRRAETYVPDLTRRMEAWQRVQNRSGAPEEPRST